MMTECQGNKLKEMNKAVKPLALTNTSLLNERERGWGGSSFPSIAGILTNYFLLGLNKKVALLLFSCLGDSDTAERILKFPDIALYSFQALRDESG